MIASLRSILFYLGYSLSLIIYASLCLLSGWLLPLRTRYRYFLLWNRFAIFWLRLCCGISYRVSGLEHLPRHPFVMVSNHQSPWETLFLYYRFGPLCAVLKAELLRIPFFGWALRLLKPIAIDRSKRKQARNALLSQGSERLAIGISVLVFPEGTRVDPGQEKKYSSGGAELAIANNIPIVPLAHNAGRFWPAHKLVKFPGTVDVVLLPAVNPAGREPKELMEELQERIRQAVRGLP